MPHSDQASIFLSHKARDEQAAREIKRTLEKFSGRLHVHIFEQALAGAPWEEWIKETLRQSDLLLLLYTDPTQEWDWCLYEAGLFTPLRTEERRPIVCLYNPLTAEHPKPLWSLQAVKAQREDVVQKFLLPLYRTTELIDVDPVLNARVSDEDLGEAAEKIAAQVAPMKITTKYYQDRIMIELPDLSFLPDDPASEVHLPDAVRVRSLAGPLPVLDLDDDEFTWGELVRRAESTRGYGTYWIDEVERAVIATAGKRNSPILTSTFRGLKEGKIYRPILYRVDRENNVPRRFYVAFNLEMEPELIGGPGTVGLAFNLLRLGSRFRWEVVDPYLKRIDRVSTPEQMTITCRQLMESIEAIENEASRHHRLDETAMRPLFDDEARPRIDAIVETWREVRQTLARTAAQRVPDGDALLESLRTLSRINREFMALTGREYRRLLDVEWAKEKAPATA